MSFANRTAIVTGSSTGIGRALCTTLAKAGAKVGAIARRGELLDALAAEVRAIGGAIETAVADVGDRDSLRTAVRSLEAKLGPVDLMVANAGVGFSTPVGEAHVDGVDRTMRVNFFGVVNAFAAASETMLPRKSGHLVAISSLAAYKGLPCESAYCASKAAVNAYCESLRIELRGRGISVTCVCPGFVATPMTAHQTNPQPMLLTADEAARRIAMAIRRKPGVFDFPWPMWLLMQLAKWAPDRVIAKNVPPMD